MGDALTATAIVALLLLVPVPAASNAPGAAADVPAAAAEPAGPLREITRVHATTSFCKTALETATAGISVAMDNDNRIANTVQGMRHTDFDVSDLAKANGLAALNRQYVDLRAEAVRGNVLLKQLKLQAANAPTPQQQHDLLAFANALDGALMRQKRLSDAIASTEAFLGNYPRLDADERSRLRVERLHELSQGVTQNPREPFEDIPDSLSKMATDSANDIEKRAEPISLDENRAADLIDPAFSGC